ncbi:response regulator [Mucilaginibacter sp. BJC16-A38]|uniref:hybrid sensor histidine kinase/response regulator transcription factor n=1 Tax=Mucilaginibacter phenanthrenivorans TaxID=1234842 RepID=UPI0021587184|nr:hybrid sensor histidine kinase/response regulator transcription factor [Mucilaginibacter phenanthrenivorans]MCR8558068.1 response regulator [Mucilaginibacter phenanthrenivorans]
MSLKITSLNCKILLLSFSMLFIVTFLRAQNNQFQFSHLDISNGLSHNNVTSIFKDSKGFMWFGTLSGLNRYDGYKFKVFKHSVSDTSSLDDDYIVNIINGPENKLWIETRNGFNIYDPATEKFGHNIVGYLHSIAIPDRFLSGIKRDRDGNFWFLHKYLGVYRYNPQTKKTIHLTHSTTDTSSISGNAVSDVAQDSAGNFWLTYRSGVMERMDPKTLRVTYRSHMFNKLPGELNSSYKIFIDKQDDIWAFVPTYSAGVYFINVKKGIFKHIDKGNDQSHLNTDVVSSVIQDDKNRIWIATDHGGVNLLNKQDFKIRFLLNREDDNKTIGQNSITLLYKDNTGIVWVGTYKKGVGYYHESIIKFPLYTHHLADPFSEQQSLSFGDVNSFAEDKTGNIWIGTNGGGLIYFDRKKGTFKTYLHDANNPNSLTNNVIVCMFIDHEQKLWIGTYFGGLDCFDGRTFKHYKHDDSRPGSISEDRICAITENSDHQLLVGTLSAGFNVFNSGTQSFSHYIYHQGDNAIQSNYVSRILEDKRKNLWIVTSYGLDVLMKETNRFIHYIHDEKNSNSLVNNSTNNIMEDVDGLIWISTHEGISIFDHKTGKFTNISKQDGLPDNAVIDLQEYDRNNVWVSTPNGLSNIIVDRSGKALKFRFVNYNETEGLQGREFTENSSLKTRDGELLFGGGNGFNMFRPSNINTNKNHPNLIFTDLQVFNQSLSVGEKVNGRVILPESITGLKSLNLKYNDNVFSIEFAALNYFNPDKIKYQYMMEGFDKGWITADNKVRKATYTNLDAGDYTFKVRATDNENWNNKELRLHISILPPFWKTTWAYILYAILILSTLLYLRKRGINKIRQQFSIEKEREEAHRMHELDLMKIKFFTNVSHEFRTPLSLIMAPVDRILKQINEPEIQRQLLLVNRNAKRLLNLVNQLLDFRKMEYQELKLHERNGEIIGFIKELSYAFTDIADQKNIRFIFDTEIELFYTAFDHDKIERILFNLLSNAYKFTHEGGQVSVLLNLVNSTEADEQQLEIRVIDTGIGIAEDKRDRIFDPFFQNDIPGSMLNQGSGIGLSITREFVKLHHGEIFVESEFNQGSCFTVLLPLREVDKKIFTDAPVQLNHAGEFTNDPVQQKNGTEKENRDGKKPAVLLVEDNDDFRFYIKDNLKSAFNIIEAENGKKGWQKALAQHPNLIVSDISMPEMNGIDLCMKIKNDKRTSHIPVILLTALIGEEQQLKGLETGASDYMTKPFNFEILQSKIRNILSQQEYMRKTYTKQVEVNPTEEHVESPDELFIKKVLLLIDNNIPNPNFSVEELSSEVFVSRYTLYKKILAMTGKTPNELVRSMRLKRAAQLLETGHLTISQICHKVGFKSQKYFVKTFKSEYNTIPSKYATAELDD